MSEEHVIDRIDRRILNALQRDGRITNHRLAEEVFLSPSACLARVKRLERDGVITGYRAQVDPTRLGTCLIVFAQISVTEHDPETFRRLQDALRDMPEAVEAHQVSGNYDFLVRFLMSDMDDWARLSSNLTDAGLHIRTIKTVVSMRVLKVWNGIPIDEATD